MPPPISTAYLGEYAPYALIRYKANGSLGCLLFKTFGRPQRSRTALREVARQIEWELRDQEDESDGEGQVIEI